MSFYIEKLGTHKKLPVIHSCIMYKGTLNYMYGQAIGNNIYYDEYNDNYIATNNEYTIIIEFCPFCGKELRKYK